MKKIIVILFLFFVQGLYAQEIKMRISQKNGQVLSYPTDSIEKITIMKHSPSWEYYVMNVYTRQGPLLPQGYDEFYMIDSMTFKGDSLKIFELGLRYWSGFSTTGATNFSHWPIDSITFSFYEKDTNVIQIVDPYFEFWGCTSQIGGLLRYVTWSNNRIYFSNPLGYFEIDTGFHITKDSVHCPLIGTDYIFSIDDSGQHFLDGGKYLREYNLKTDSETIYLKEIDSNISSAQYYNRDSILYYSYGPSFSQSNQSPADAGYYFYDKKTNKSSFILNFISEVGMNEVVNGFDISPNRKKLLIPVIRKKDAPFLIEYDFATGHKDTLHTTVFDKFEGSWSLWVRYSHDGSKILYDLYPYGTFGLAFYGSQTGIIDRSSLSGKIIHTSPDNESTWITVFPQWSPDDREIMCCTASISTEPAGFVDAFGVYILKNIK